MFPFESSRLVLAVAGTDEEAGWAGIRWFVWGDEESEFLGPIQALTAALQGVELVLCCGGEVSAVATHADSMEVPGSVSAITNVNRVKVHDFTIHGETLTRDVLALGRLPGFDDVRDWHPLCAGCPFHTLDFDQDTHSTFVRAFQGCVGRHAH